MCSLATYILFFFSNGSGTTYQPGGSYTANANATLYVQWSTPAIGSYVSYTPSVTSGPVLTSVTGYSSDQAYNPSSTTSWKIFNIDNGVTSIIPATSAGNITLYGLTGWQRIAYTLNTMCNDYVNSTYATSARSLGYDSSTALVRTDNSGTAETINASDLAIVEANSSLNIAGTLIPARAFFTRVQNGIAGWAYIVAGSMVQDGFPPLLFAPNSDFMLYKSGGSNNLTGNVRPVVTLKSTIRITGGSGTSASPYTLGT